MVELFLAELNRTWIEFRRYPFEAFGVVFITTTIFYGLFLSARYIAGPSLQLGERLDAVIVGYVLWSLVVFIIGNISSTLQFEAQTGTLEQLFLSKFGALQVFLTRSLASLSLQLMINLGILLVIILLTGSQLNFSVALLPPLLTVILAAYGVAFAVASLTLVVKRVQQIQVIIQFGLLFLLATPTETWTGTSKTLAQLLPMTMGAGLLRDLMARNLPLNWQVWSSALAISSLYLGVGLLLFYGAEKMVKRRGVLGGY
jgi:ABC-2 type transport system permease protein